MHDMIVIYMVWSIADISDPSRYIYRGAKRRGKYATEIGYRGYGPTYHMIYVIPYGMDRRIFLH